MRKNPAGCSRRSRCEAAPDGRTRGVLRLASRAGGEASGPGDPGERERATLSVRPRAPYRRRWAFFSSPLDQRDLEDLADRELRHHLHAGLGDPDHLLDAHAVLAGSAMLSLDGEGHVLFQRDVGRVERHLTPDDGRLVEGEPDAMGPVAARRLVLADDVDVLPDLWARRPLLGDLARGDAGLDDVDGVVEPVQRQLVVVLRLLGGLAAAVRPVDARLVAHVGGVVGVHVEDIPGPDDAVALVPRVRPGEGARGHEDAGVDAGAEVIGGLVGDAAELALLDT